MKIGMERKERGDCLPKVEEAPPFRTGGASFNLEIPFHTSCYKFFDNVTSLLIFMCVYI